MAPDFERLARMPWPIACCASSGTKTLKLGLGLFVFEVGGPGADKDACELRPGIGGAHINNANGLDPRLWRLDPEQARELAVLYTAPELPFSGDNEVLVKRIGMGGDLHPFAAAGND